MLANSISLGQKGQHRPSGGRLALKLSHLMHSRRLLGALSDIQAQKLPYEQILDQKKIAVCTGQRVCRVHCDAVELETGATIPSDLTVWLSGAAASPVFQEFRSVSG